MRPRGRHSSTDSSTTERGVTCSKLSRQFDRTKLAVLTDEVVGRSFETCRSFLRQWVKIKYVAGLHTGKLELGRLDTWEGTRGQLVVRLTRSSSRYWDDNDSKDVLPSTSDVLTDVRNADFSLWSCERSDYDVRWVSDFSCWTDGSERKTFVNFSVAEI